MAGNAPQTDWYVARDGQQYGPLTDLEMRKFVELGHLRPTDLVWRQGFPDWRPAPAVFPAPVQRPQLEPHRPAPQRVHHSAAAPAAQPHAAQPHAAPRQTYRAADPAMSAAGQVAVAAPYDDDDGVDSEDEDLHPRTSRSRGRRFAKLLVLVALIGGGSWLAVDHIPDPAKLLSLLETRGESSDPAEPPQEVPSAQAPEGIGSSAEEIDASLQRAALWQLIKQEFPDWYQERTGEAARLKSEGRDDAFITRHLAQALVELRRQNASQALAASPATVRNIAGSFLDNLKHLSAYSVQACYGFISQGETSPQVLELMSQPEHAEPLQRQAAAMFAAVAEGRRSPQTHLPPRQADYQALTEALTNLGWTDKDVQLFSDPRALAQAAPEEVCRLVQDWFAAQLSIPDQDVQLRLLIESLKPVVAG